MQISALLETLSGGQEDTLPTMVLLLLYEKSHRTTTGSKSFWRPYLDSLPSFYPIPQVRSRYLAYMFCFYSFEKYLCAFALSDLIPLSSARITSHEHDFDPH